MRDADDPKIIRDANQIVAAAWDAWGQIAPRQGRRRMRDRVLFSCSHLPIPTKETLKHEGAYKLAVMTHIEAMRDADDERFFFDFDLWDALCTQPQPLIADLWLLLPERQVYALPFWYRVVPLLQVICREFLEIPAEHIVDTLIHTTACGVHDAAGINLLILVQEEEER